MGVQGIETETFRLQGEIGQAEIVLSKDQTKASIFITDPVNGDRWYSMFGSINVDNLFNVLVEGLHNDQEDIEELSYSGGGLVAAEQYYANSPTRIERGGRKDSERGATSYNAGASEDWRDHSTSRDWRLLSQAGCSRTMVGPYANGIRLHRKALVLTRGQITFITKDFDLRSAVVSKMINEDPVERAILNSASMCCELAGITDEFTWAWVVSYFKKRLLDEKTGTLALDLTKEEVTIVVDEQKRGSPVSTGCRKGEIRAPQTL